MQALVPNHEHANSEGPLGSIAAIEEQLDALIDAQRSNLRILDALQSRPLVKAADTEELVGLVDIIEGYMEAVVDLREHHAREPPNHPSPIPEPPRPPSSGPSDNGEGVDDTGIKIPDPAVLTLTQMLDEVMLSSSTIPDLPVQPPPPLIHFVYNPAPPSRRSPSPIFVKPDFATRVPPLRDAGVPPTTIRPPRPRRNPRHIPQPRSHRERSHAQPPVPRTTDRETERDTEAEIRAVQEIRENRLAKIDQAFISNLPSRQADPGPLRARPTEASSGGRPILEEALIESGRQGPESRAEQHQEQNLPLRYVPPLTEPQHKPEAGDAQHRRGQRSTAAQTATRNRHQHQATNAVPPPNEPPTFAGSSWYRPPPRPPLRPSPRTVVFPQQEITDAMLAILRVRSSGFFALRSICGPDPRWL
jgi:hypothetical protein